MNRRGFLKNLLGGAIVTIPLLSSIVFAKDEIIDVKDDSLVGYKGRPGDMMDSGYFYCPYIPLMVSGES